MSREKSIYWVGTSYKDLLEFPSDAKQDAGYQLHRIQNGLNPEDWKPFQKNHKKHHPKILILLEIDITQL